MDMYQKRKIRAEKKKDDRTGRYKKSETLIFPRYHQFNAVRKIVHDIKINETFIMNNNKYIVVLNKMLNCKDCSFNCRVECGSVKCAANERGDRKSVTFKKIP